MDRQIRYYATNIAKNIVSKNLLLILGLGIIVALPSIAINAIMQLTIFANQVKFEYSLYYATSDIEVFKALFSLILPIIGFTFLAFITTIILYPINVGVVQVYKKLIECKETKISDVFSVFSTNAGKSYKLFLSIFLRSIPLAIISIIGVLLCFSSFFFTLFLEFSLLLIIISSALFIIGFIMVMISTFMQNKLSILEIFSMYHIDKENYTVSNASDDINKVFSGRKYTLYIFPLFFFGWILISALLATFTMGLSSMIYNAFYTIVVAIYVQTNIDEYNKNNRGEF